MLRRSLWCWLVALAVVLSACSVDATVTVKVRHNGSGYVAVDVAVDAEAVQAAEVGGGKLEDRVRLSDLPAAGWKVDPWVRNDDGSATLSMRKSFTSVDEIPGILDELNGKHGPLQQSEFTRRRSFFATKFGAHARVDLGAIATGITDDAELVSRLQAQGVDVAGIDKQLLAELQRAFSVKLVVELPGHKPVTVEPAAGAAASLDASSSVKDTTRLTLVAVALGLVVLAIVVALWPRRRRRKRSRRQQRGAASTRTRTPVSSAPGVPPTRRGTRPTS